MKQTMLTRRLAIAVGAALLAAGLVPGRAQAQDKINAIATFSILGDLVKNVGGDRVDVVTLVGPDCLLYTSPSPRDRQKSRMPSSA